MIPGNLAKLLRELFWQRSHYCWIDGKPEIAFIELQSFRRFQRKINSPMQWAIQTNQANDKIGFRATLQNKQICRSRQKKLEMLTYTFLYQVNLRARKVSATNLLQLSSSINSIYGLDFNITLGTYIPYFEIVCFVQMTKLWWVYILLLTNGHCYTS